MDVLRGHHPRGRPEDAPPALRARARRGARWRDDQLLQIDEFLHPRVAGDRRHAAGRRSAAGCCDTGWPRAPGRALRASRAASCRPARCAAICCSTSLAGLRRWRRATLRFAQENARIEAWLAQIRDAARRHDHALAVEIAALPAPGQGLQRHARARRCATSSALMAALPAVRGSRTPPLACAGCARRRWPTSTAQRAGAARCKPPDCEHEHDGSQADPTEAESIRALVQADRVHRDLYIDPELFDLEQEHFFANTWNYVGHVSQVPSPATTSRPRSPAAPLIVVRHADGTRAGADEPLRAQGLAVVSAPAATPASSSAARTTPGPSTPTARCSPSR